MKKLLLITLLIFFASEYGNAQEYRKVNLKDGTTIEGSVINQTIGESISIRTSDGQVFTIPESQILSSTIKAYKQKGFIWGIDISGNFSHDFSFQPSVMFGYRFTPKCELSIGAGGNIGGVYSFNPFVNFSSHLMPKARVSPYAALKAGYNIRVKNEYLEGFFIEPSLGISFNLRKGGRIYIAGKFEGQKIAEGIERPGKDYYYGGGFKIGYIH